MARKAIWLGRASVGRYELGTRPDYFQGGIGFAMKFCLHDNIPPGFIHRVLQIELKVGEVVKLKPKPMAFEWPTDKDLEGGQEWKSGIR